MYFSLGFNALFLTSIEKKKLEGDQPHYQCVKGSSEFTARMKEYNLRKRSPYMVSFNLFFSFIQTSVNTKYELV